MLLQQTQSLHNHVEGALSSFVMAVLVMDLLWSVKTDANHEIMFFQEFAPSFCKQGTIGLERVFDGFCIAKRSLQFDNPLEEFHAQQGRLTTLPNEFNNRW